MGLLTRAGNVLGDIGRRVPAGSTRERMINALTGGVEKTQNLLAGRYAQAIQDAMSPANSSQYAPLAYGLIGAGGSVAGNVMSGEDKDPGRILLEAAGAGGLGALAGSKIGALGQSSNITRANYLDIAQGYGEASLPYLNRGIKAAEAGATSTAQAALDKAADYGNKVLAAQKKAMNAIEANRLKQGLYMASLPGIAGLGGMAGGGVSNVAQYMGVPGLQQNVITDPELAGSSNTPMARSSTPTLRYLS